jgi:polysaccharide export outer membrane protein
VLNGRKAWITSAGVSHVYVGAARMTAGSRGGIFRQAAGATAAPADLPLGPGDLLEISVVDMPEMSGRRVRIPRQGTVNLPLLGEVMVAGRTSAEVEEDLRKRLQEKYMHDPQVAVFVHERRSQRVSVLGAVKKGGVFELSGRMRLADALAMAEGLTDDADQVIFLFRRAPSDVVARAAAQGGARAQAASAQNAPATGQQQSTPAEGARPGELTDVMTTVDLEAIAAGNEELNVPLEAGDVIQVPRAGSVYVGGSVVKPGPVQLRGRTTVHQAIVAAGGPTNVAAWGDVRLYRKKPDGQVEIKTFDLDEFEAGKEVPVVQKNDVVVVGKSAIKAFFYGSLDLLRGVFGVGVGL